MNSPARSAPLGLGDRHGPEHGTRPTRPHNLDPHRLALVAHTLQAYYAALLQTGSTQAWRGQMLDFDGGSAHAERTVLGSTRRAFQMPSRLASVEMTRTMKPSEIRSDGSTTTRRGKWGNVNCPMPHASA